MTIFELRAFLAVFLIWAVAVVAVAGRRTSPPWTKWALFLPVVLFLRGNPFSSPVSALVFLTLASAVAVLFGLSLPIGWAFGGHLGATWALIVSALILAMPFLLQGAAPRRRWLGVVLAGLLGPWGQWYLEDGGRWLVAVSAVAFAAGLIGQLVSTLGMTGADPVRLPEFPQVWLGWPGAGFHLASAFVMYLRFSWSGADARIASGAPL